MQIYDLLPTESLTPIRLENTPYMDELVAISGIKPATSISERPVVISEAPKQKNKGFSTVKQSDAIREIQRKIISDTTSDDNKIDTDNYQFNAGDISNEDIKNWDFSMLDVPLPDQKAKDTPPKRLNYNVEYFISEIVTQIDFSYLNQTYQPYTGGSSPIFLNPGFNALFKIGVTDLLEDYRIVGGVRLSLNLVNNEYLLSYANLKKRLDREIIFHRNSIESYDSYYSIIRVYTHELFYVVKYPFNPVMALKATASFRNDLAVFLSTDVVNLAEPNKFRNLVGAKGEFIYDNTKNLGVNLFHGTRFKIFGEYYQWVDSEADNLVVVGFDIRNYQRIHRTFIWANRFAISSSFGNNKLIYYMGGVDNWLFPKFNISTPVDQEQNYAYQTLATNMRGFNQNITVNCGFQYSDIWPTNQLSLIS